MESALEGEITDHLGYDRHVPAGRDGGDSRNGHRTKTAWTEVGPVEIDVPRDRNGSFQPQIVAKRQRRLSGVDEQDLRISRSRMPAIPASGFVISDVRRAPGAAAAGAEQRRSSFRISGTRTSVVAPTGFEPALPP
uniref:transposase n=1 Tax=Pseudonocardia asaccharolytica TaxID=54010 RepID=UPI0035A236A3